MQLQKTIIHYNDKSVELPPNKMSFFDEFYVDFKTIKEGKYQRIQMTLHPKGEVVLQQIELQFEQSYEHSSNRSIFCNGFQSWSESREYSKEESIPTLKGIAKPYMQYYGDYHFPMIKRGKGLLHSWTYSYIRSNDKLNFIGSINERMAFTLIQHDTTKNTMTVNCDCAKHHLEHSFPILDLFLMQGKETDVFDAYFETLECPPPKAKPAVGWTSWYHYYTKISEEIILKNLEAYAEKEEAIDIFQIDDGYQTAVGDWLSIKPNFPNGMGSIAQKIHQHNYKAGLWLAPFICEKNSDIFKNKKAWLLKDEQNKPIKAGYNPGWSGWFYVLDFYNKEVQEYLTTVLHTMLSKWNFDLLKVDFLYAVCILPRHNKTRGQIMYDAMDFLRQIVDKKLILGCGVPLGSSFGLVDYCRIGADIHLKWEHKLLKWLRNRERVSTAIALNSTIGRWQLNGRAWQNDPDVFLLRDKKNSLTPTQQYTILLLNTLLGNVLFTSDFVGDYSDEQWGEYQEMLHWKDSSINKVQVLDNDRYLIHLQNKNKHYTAACNLSARKTNIPINKNTIELEPYESMILESR